MKRLHTEFLKMKNFFTERQDGYVYYRVKRLSFGDASSDYCTMERFRDGFYIEFDWNAGGDPNKYGIESYDSFVFGIYCIYYGDRIEFTDCNRTWECGVEAFEGTGLMGEHFDEVEAFINKHGFSFSDKPRQSTLIHKVTSPDTFVRDAIELIRIMLLINSMDGTAPYVHEDNASVLNDIAMLEKSWLTDAPDSKPEGTRRVIDLTHAICEGMPVYPGDEPVETSICDRRSDGGARIANIRLNSHTGTHVDAPSHYFEGARTLTDFTPDSFIGKALVIDCRNLKEGEQITKEMLLEYGERLNEADFLLFNTGWDKKWGKPDYFSGYPTLDLWSAILICKGNFKGIGLDAPSLDLPSDARFMRHKQILSDNNLLVIENLKNLELLGDGLVSFAALPLKLDEGDGAPVRAIAWVN